MRRHLQFLFFDTSAQPSQQTIPAMSMLYTPESVANMCGKHHGRLFDTFFAVILTVFQYFCFNVSLPCMHFYWSEMSNIYKRLVTACCSTFKVLKFMHDSFWSKIKTAEVFGLEYVEQTSAGYRIVTIKQRMWSSRCLSFAASPPDHFAAK